MFSCCIDNSGEHPTYDEGDDFDTVMRKRKDKRIARQEKYYILADGRRIGYRDMLGLLHVVTTSRKRFEIDGKFYRVRRGVAVEIPEKWVGKVTDPQTMRKRHSKRGQGKSFRAKVQRKKRKAR